MKETMKDFFGCLLFVSFMFVLLVFFTGCATTGQRGVVNVVNRSDTTTTTFTNGPTNVVSVSNASQQGFFKPRWSIWGLIFGDSPTPTAVPSRYSVENGQPPAPIVVVEQPYPYNPYGYGYGGSYYGGGYGYGGYPYRRVYYGEGGQSRTLFGYQFKSP